MAGNSNAVQVRIDPENATQAAGSRAHDLRLGHQPDYVDGARAHLNRVLVRSLTGSQLRKVCEERRSQRQTKRAMKANAAVCVSGIITFGHAAQRIFATLSANEQDAAYREAAEAVAARIGTTVSGLVIHRDEAADHAHFQCPGFTLDGQPVTKVANRAALRDFQTIAAEIMARHCPGIERGTPRFKRIEAGDTYADTVYKSAAAMRDRLPADIAAREAELAKLQGQIEAAEERQRLNEERAAKALAKAGVDEDRAAKALRNAETYERRASDARQTIEKLTAAITELEKEATEAREAVSALYAEWEEAAEHLAPARVSVAAYDAYLARQAGWKHPVARYWQGALDAIRSVLLGPIVDRWGLDLRGIAVVLAHPLSAGALGRDWSVDPRENLRELQTMDVNAARLGPEDADWAKRLRQWPSLAGFDDPTFREGLRNAGGRQTGIRWAAWPDLAQMFPAHRNLIETVARALGTMFRDTGNLPEPPLPDPLPASAEMAAEMPASVRRAIRTIKPGGPSGP